MEWVTSIICTPELIPRITAFMAAGYKSPKSVVREIMDMNSIRLFAISHYVELKNNIKM